MIGENQSDVSILCDEEKTEEVSVYLNSTEVWWQMVTSDLILNNLTECVLNPIIESFLHYSLANMSPSSICGFFFNIMLFTLLA